MTAAQIHVVVWFVAAILVAGPVAACSCHRRPLTADFDEASSVFLGETLDAYDDCEINCRDLPGGGESCSVPDCSIYYVFGVTARWKGPDDDHRRTDRTPLQDHNCRPG